MHPDLAWQLACMQSREQERQLQNRLFMSESVRRNLRQQLAFRCGLTLLRCSRWLLRYGHPSVPARPTPRIR